MDRLIGPPLQSTPADTGAPAKAPREMPDDPEEFMHHRELFEQSISS